VFLPNSAGPGGSNSGIFQTENQVQISADGQRTADNNFMIDGVSVNSLTHGGAAVVTPNQEAVGQMTVISSAYDASLGRNTGAQIQVVTRSGTNSFHGSAFFLFDEPGLNAYNHYAGPVPGTPRIRDNNKQRTWAGSVGGPILKNHAFFFASFQEFKQKNPSYTNAYVETPQLRQAIAAQRTGGVSARILANPGSQPRILAVITPSCTGFNSYNTGPAPTTGGNQPTATACRVVGGGIDIGSLTPGGATQLGVFPATTPIAGSPVIGGTAYGPTPQQVGGGLDNVPDLENVQLYIPQQARGNQYNARVDFQLTPNDLLAGSVYFTKLDNLGASGAAGSRPFGDVPFKPFNSAATLIYIHTFSPRWINELRGNSTRFADNALSDAGNTVNYGIPYINVQNYPFALQYGVAAAVTTPANFAENTYEVRDTVSATMGAHTTRAGVELRFEQDNDNLYGYDRPTYAFNGVWAFANDASVFEQQYANPTNGAPASTQRYFRSENYAAFVQHDWKVTPNLTVNAGLRWEEFTPLANKGFQTNYPVLGPAGSELSGMTLIPHNHLWNFQHNNWGPRLGFAYTPPSLNNKMVIRGGYALAYNHLDTALFNAAVEDGPGVANFGLCCGGPTSTAGIVYSLGSSNSPTSFPVNPAFATGLTANGFPKGVGQVEVYGAPYGLKYPSSDIYSFEIQQTIGFASTMTLGYSGSTGHHYARLVNQNFLYNNANSPVFASYFAQTDSSQNYNSLNVQLRRPMRNDISYSFVYTYAKSLDQVSNGDFGDAGANQTNPANNASEYGPSDYDLRHRIVATAVLQTPKVHTHNAIADALVNGFQGNFVYNWHTGYPWTPTLSTYSTVPIVNGAAVQNVVRPLAYFGGAGSSCSNGAFVSGSNFPNRTGANGGSNYFATTLPAGTIYKPGIGRNSFRGPCYQRWDISLAKEFGFDHADHHTLLRFQMNMFNAFNQLQLTPIGNYTNGSTINNAYFGYAQSADAGRVIDLQARFQF
jgi:hypothetical protein